MMTNESALAAAHLYAKREELLNHVLGIVRGDGVILVAPVEGGPIKVVERREVKCRISSERRQLGIDASISAR